MIYKRGDIVEYEHTSFDPNLYVVHHVEDQTIFLAPMTGRGNWSYSEGLAPFFASYLGMWTKVGEVSDADSKG